LDGKLAPAVVKVVTVTPSRTSHGYDTAPRRPLPPGRLTSTTPAPKSLHEVTSSRSSPGPGCLASRWMIST